MNDIKTIATERANRKKEAPVGRCIETEHQRAKRALVSQIDALDGRNIQLIAAAQEDEKNEGLLRVAAYCRVSTDDIDQAISIALQVKESKRKIKENPNWKYVGTYVDDGFSGTNTEHRQGFQKLMADALDGKIDLIITKAVSRFARNLMDCIVWVEALQNHDPPVRVYFEQENLDTMAQTSSIILIVLAMVAQEESHMKSEAVLLSLEWRFSRGRFITPRLFGYDVTEVPDSFGGKKKILSVNEPEARVVRWLYYNLLNGLSLDSMAGVLTDLSIPTGGRRRDGTLNTHWTGKRIRTILRNERYCGDVLARKTYTPNYKDHKSKKNNGKKNKYYQADHHDAIVSRSVWNAAQRVLNSLNIGTYLPMRVIDRGSLAGFISMNRSWAGFDAGDYYRASQIAMGLLEGELEANLEKEYCPEAGRRAGGLVDDHGISRIARELSKAEREIKEELEGKSLDGKPAFDREEAVKSFQVVGGEMFSLANEPVVRISKKFISFSSACISRMSTDYTELLYNPVERMAVARPCGPDHPNAIKWEAKKIGAASLCGILYESLGWDADYTYRIPCQAVTRDGKTVLIFDLDNYIGRAASRKEEKIIIPKKAEKENARSYYYPPEDEDEPQEITDMEERFQKIREQNKRIFGRPVFDFENGIRFFPGSRQNEDGPWDMLAEARPLDTTHAVSQETVDNLLAEIKEDPPEFPKEACLVFTDEGGAVVDCGSVDEGGHV